MEKLVNKLTINAEKDYVPKYDREAKKRARAGYAKARDKQRDKARKAKLSTRVEEEVVENEQ